MLQEDSLCFPSYGTAVHLYLRRWTAHRVVLILVSKKGRTQGFDYWGSATVTGTLLQVQNEARRELAELVRWIYSKGWAPGTGGNFGLVVSEDPLRLLITPSGQDKGSIAPEDLLLVDSGGRNADDDRKPSAETLLHLAIIEQRKPRLIVHIHTVWNTLISLAQGSECRITGLEMLKGLTGVATHEHEEIIPILENSQNMPKLAARMTDALRRYPTAHGVLLRGHGLYTWGYNVEEARRHLEIFEFLFEVTVRAKTVGH